MLVSVIIPNYNHAAYLKQRIDTILNQTYQDFEIILLDDCSNDNSREVIEQYRHHPKISQIIYDEQNGGSVYKQWKKGFELAEGEWIWIAESDDWCEPGFLQEMFCLISEDSNAVLAYCQSVAVQEDTILWQCKTSYLKEVLEGKQWIIKYMLGACGLVNASMAVFKKSTLKNIDDSFVYFKQCGDWKLWCEIAKQGTVFISGKYLNFFRQHSKNTTTKQLREGYYYSEGSELFSQLIKEHHLTHEQVYYGMMKFLNSFERDKYLFTREQANELSERIRGIAPVIADKVKYAIRLQKSKQWIKSILKRLSP